MKQPCTIDFLATGLWLFLINWSFCADWTIRVKVASEVFSKTETVNRQCVAIDKEMGEFLTFYFVEVPQRQGCHYPGAITVTWKPLNVLTRLPIFYFKNLHLCNRTIHSEIVSLHNVDGSIFYQISTVPKKRYNVLYPLDCHSSPWESGCLNIMSVAIFSRLLSCFFLKKTYYIFPTSIPPKIVVPTCKCVIFYNFTHSSGILSGDRNESRHNPVLHLFPSGNLFSLGEHKFITANLFHEEWKLLKM